MEKGTIVYLDGIKCHMGEIDHQITIDGDEYYILSACLIDGDFKEYGFTDEEAVEEGLYIPVECCREASQEDIAEFKSYRL